MLEHAYDERGVRVVAVRVTTTTTPSSTLPPRIHLVVLGQLERERENTGRMALRSTRLSASSRESVASYLCQSMLTLRSVC